MAVDAVSMALADAEPSSFWLQDVPPRQPCDPVDGLLHADLLVVGGGFTGLWAAIEAKRADPSREVVLLDAGRLAEAASGRNGGFIAESLTHGLAHGVAMWPDQMPELLRQGRENLDEIASLLDEYGIDACLRRQGKSVVALKPAHLDGLARSCALHLAHGEQATVLDRDQAQADVHSPTYLGALRVHTGGGTVHPGLLAHGLIAIAGRLGVRVHEHSPVSSLRRAGAGLIARTNAGEVRARQAVLATNAFPPLLRRLRSWIVPVADHVLVTEPLSTGQRAAIGWQQEQGLTDPGNRFHYYRLTPDGRILFGGYDAAYHFGGRIQADDPARMRSFRTLAGHFQATFPQLEGLRFSHRWFGTIDTTSRFTPLFGTALDGRAAYAVGFTGLGVGSSRFGARTALDLLDQAHTERTSLRLVRRRPVPFPPEPIRYPLIRITQAALESEDRTSVRGPYLRLLDRLGVGFDS
jgi:glycine/D-amino acid oxidase-like deaminating enzyme